MPVHLVAEGRPTDDAEQTYLNFSKRRTTFLIYASSAVLGCSIALFGALSTWIQSELDLNQSEAGFTQTIFFIGHLSGALLVGMTISRWPLHRSWLLAVSCSMLGNFLCGSPTYLAILAGRYLAGLGLSSTIVIATHALTNLYPKSSSRALNLLHALIATTAALTFMTARQLTEALNSWECGFLITGLLAMVPVSLAIFLPLRIDRPAEDDLNDCERPDTALDRHLARSRWLGADVLILLPVVIGYVALEQSMSLFLPGSLESRFGWSATSAANVGALFWFGIILGRVGSSIITSYVDERRQLFWGGVLMGGCLLASLHVSWAPAMYLLVFLGGLTGGPLVPLGFAMTSRLAGSKSAQALIACQLSCCFGGMTGPFGVGLLADATGLITSLSTYCMMTMLAVLPLLLLAIWSRVRQPQVATLLAPAIDPREHHNFEPIRPLHEGRNEFGETVERERQYA